MEYHSERSKNPPTPEPEIDTSKRYDVYCTDPKGELVVYRNALFKGTASLLPSPGGRTLHPSFVDLEQANGQSVFISRHSIFRFCEPGTELVAEAAAPKQSERR